MRIPPAAVVEEQVLAMPVVREGTRAIAEDVSRTAKGLAYDRAHDSGEFAARIETREGSGPTITVVATDRKSEWLEEGTGIYGPKKTPIKPKHGKFLVFRVDRQRVSSGDPTTGFQQTKTQGELIFARQVRGRPASWIMRDAAQRVAERRGMRFVNNRRFQG